MKTQCSTNTTETLYLPQPDETSQH